MNEVTKLVAKYAIIVPVLIVLYVFIRMKDNHSRINFAILLCAGGLLSLVLAKISGHLIYDPRPFVVGHFTPLIPHTNDNGFPSDHTLLASFLGFALLPYAKKLGLLTLAIAACIGLARIAAGIHHLQDIIGSFVITAGATLVVLAILELVRPHHSDAQ